MPTHPYQVAAIILAAGGSKRFGSQKMAHRYNNKSLLEHSVEKIDSTVFQSTIIVTGANSDALIAQHQHLQNHCDFINNPNWQSGLSSSIATGIAALEKTKPKVNAALILLGDQIALEQKALNTMAILAAKHPDTIICAHYNNKNGAPAIFPDRYFTALKQLRGDKGASALLNDPTTQVLPVNITSAAKDIDTPNDLKQS